VVVAVSIPLHHVFATRLQLDLSAFCTGRRVLGFTGRFFSSGISSASKSTTPLQGEQPSDLTFDLEHFLVADLFNCNYNLAII
jgi:hypothetical protein